jgi:hypothetical protein
MPVTGVNDPFRIQNIDRSDLYIEAFMHGGSGDYARVQIDLDRIAYRKEIDEKTSALVLADGTEIWVALSLKDLRQKINEHSFKDGEMIDLKPFTGAAANISPDGSLKIKLYVHFNETSNREFVIATIDDRHVNEYRTGSNDTYISLKDEFKNLELISPCKNGVFTTLPLKTLNSKIEAAKQKHLAVLDLTNETTPVAATKIRPPITL